MLFNLKLLAAHQILRNIQNEDLEVNLKEYHDLLDCLIFLHETLAELKVKMPHWKTYSDTLMTKFYLHSQSFEHVLSGIELKSKYFNNELLNKKIIDVPSSKILLRGQLEAFLMYQHIYVNANDENEKELRFNAWIYSSLLQRQSFSDNSDIGKIQKLKDKKEIESLKNEISRSSAFAKLSTKQQIGLLEKGSGKLFKTWDIILKESGFANDHLVNTLYAVLSSYAHSEGLSIIQIKQSQLGYNKHNEEAKTILFVSKILVCMMIVTIKKLYKIVEVKYNGLPQHLQNTIEAYVSIGKQMNSKA